MSCHCVEQISDFGLSRWKSFSRTCTRVGGNSAGTPSHTSPEKWANINYREDERCDVYSFSILLWEMFTEKKAFVENRGSLYPRVTSVSLYKFYI